MTFAIILSIIAAILSIIAFSWGVIMFFSFIAEGDKTSAVLTAIIVSILVFITIYNICNESPKNQTTVVKDIQGFSVDTTLTISGTDTTKTYTLTYWK